MRKGWEIKKMGEVCDIKHGFAFEGKNFESDYLGENPIVLTPGNFSENSSLVFNEKNTKRCLGLYPKEYEFQVGDIVVVMTDLSSKMKILGKPAIIESNNILHNQRIGKFIFFDNTLEKTYLFYLLQTQSYLKEIKSSATGTMVRHTAPKRILDYKIPIPPLPEQQRIVSILDEAFSSIEQAKENLQRNLQNAKELFQSELNSIFSNKGEGWAEKKLGEVCLLYQGIAINAKTKHSIVAKSELPLLRIKDLKNNTVEQYIDPYNYPKNALVNAEDIIYTRTGSLGLVFRGFYGVLHNNSFKVVPNNEITRDFLFEFLQSPTFYNKIILLSGKAAQPDITHLLFKQQVISFPKSIQTQQKIVQQLDKLSTETKRLEAMYQQKLDALEELKKSILQKAFSGELS